MNIIRNNQCQSASQRWDHSSLYIISKIISKLSWKLQTLLLSLLLDPQISKEYPKTILVNAYNNSVIISKLSQYLSLIIWSTSQLICWLMSCSYPVHCQIVPGIFVQWFIQIAEKLLTVSLLKELNPCMLWHYSCVLDKSYVYIQTYCFRHHCYYAYYLSADGWPWTNQREK